LNRTHILPMNDTFRHEESDTCSCMPRLRDGALVVHNSYDRREVGAVMLRALVMLAQHVTEWSEDERDAYDHAISLIYMHWPQTETPDE